MSPESMNKHTVDMDRFPATIAPKDIPEIKTNIIKVKAKRIFSREIWTATDRKTGEIISTFGPDNNLPTVKMSHDAIAYRRRGCGGEMIEDDKVTAKRCIVTVEIIED